MSELLVPIRVDAIRVDRPQQVTGPRSDFEILPWFDGTRDHSSTVPNLARAINAEPFADHQYWLDTGVHLHWTLPDGLTRGATERSAERPIKVDDLWFPAVPNRWLVLRRTTDMFAEDNIVRAWLVESDYVHAGTDRPDARAIAYPAPDADPGKPPYLYIGRQTELDPVGLVPGADFVPMTGWTLFSNFGAPLTALGYGDPMFAAHYPTSRSAFGLHDDRLPDGETCYDVYGWYSEDVPDPLQAMVATLGTDEHRQRALLLAERRRVDPAIPEPQEILSGPDRINAARVAAAKTFGWSVYVDGGQAFPDRILCHARTVFTPEPDQDAETPASPASPASPGAQAPPPTAEIGFGASAAEAYAAYLIGGAPRNVSLSDDDEDRLVQTLAATDLANHPLDLGLKLREARHSEQFKPVPGRRLWMLRARDDDLPDEASPALVIPDHLAEDLHRLNSLQAEYDDRREEIDGLRQQLFADWSHFMQAAYPEGTQDPFAVDLDDLHGLIDRTLLAPLERLLAETGTLHIGEDDEGHTALSAEPIVRGHSAGALAGSPVQTLVAPRERIAEISLRHGAAVTGIELAGAHAETATTGGGGDLVRIALRRGEAIAEISGVAGKIDGQPAIGHLAVATSHGRTFGPFAEDLPDGAPFRLPVPRGMRLTGLVRWEARHLAGIELLLCAEHETAPALPPGAVSLAARIVEQFAVISRDLAEYDEHGANLTLGIAPGPRYWMPNDPLIALGQETLRPSVRHGHDGLLAVAPGEPDERMSSKGLHDTFVFVPGTGTTHARYLGGASRAPVGFERQWWHRDGHLPYLTRSVGENRHPVEVEWQAEMRPLREGGNAGQSRYDTDFVIRNHALDSERCDLDQTSIDLAPAYEYVAGRSIINPSIGRLLQARLQKDRGSGPVARLGAAAAEPAPVILALGGFHDQLLMRAHEPQVAIADPIGLPMQQTLARRVADVMGAYHPTSPLPDAPFHPIRSGEIVIQRLREIDSFGRSREWRPDRVRTTRRLQPPSGGIDQARLPVRLCQPSQLDLRWLSALDGAAESNAHPASTPICGWILPDALDGNLVFYAGSGVMIGTVTDEARWLPAPGAAAPVRLPREIPDPTLRRIVEWLVSEGDEALIDAFVETLDAALERIDPMDAATHQARAMLIGRPVAVVRARVGVSLQHALVQDQSLRALRARIAGGEGGTHGYERVRFGVRLGEHGQLNDGLCGYWIERDGRYGDDGFLTPTGLTSEATHPRIRYLDGGPAGAMPLQVSLAGAPEMVTMLVDPRGTVHATSGILPTKSIAIPRDHYLHVLDALRVTFPTGPILTPPDGIEVPLPTEPGYSWSWLEHDGTRFVETPHHPIVRRAALVAGFGTVGPALWDRLVGLGRLQPADDRESGLLLNAPHDAPADRFDDLALDPETVERGLHAIAHGIDDTSHQARLTRRVVARDGWLQLRQMPVIDPVTGDET